MASDPIVLHMDDTTPDDEDVDPEITWHCDSCGDAETDDDEKFKDCPNHVHVCGDCWHEGADGYCLHCVEEGLAYTTWECYDCCAEHSGGSPEDLACGCGNYICPTCVTQYGGHWYCKSCAEDLQAPEPTVCPGCHDMIGSKYWCPGHGAYVCTKCWGAGKQGYCKPCVDDPAIDIYTSGIPDPHKKINPHSGSKATNGTSVAPGWEARGTPIIIDHYKVACERGGDWTKHWPIDKKLSLYRGAAEFYLLEAVAHNLMCGREIHEPLLVVLADEAKQARQQIVDAYDPAFSMYADMAIGGELRYHQAFGVRCVRNARWEAWIDWKFIRAEIGPQALLDAAELFRELGGPNGKGGIGGEAWAVAAELLHMRVTGKITPAEWVDRCFTLQHNGGCFLNKIAWGPHENEDGSIITHKIGPYHQCDPPNWIGLLRHAGDPVKQLWRDWWPAMNRNRRIQGLDMLVFDDRAGRRVARTKQLTHDWVHALGGSKFSFALAGIYDEADDEAALGAALVPFFLSATGNGTAESYLAECNELKVAVGLLYMHHGFVPSSFWQACQIAKTMPRIYYANGSFQFGYIPWDEISAGCPHADDFVPVFESWGYPTSSTEYYKLQAQAVEKKKNPVKKAAKQADALAGVFDEVAWSGYSYTINTGTATTVSLDDVEKMLKKANAKWTPVEGEAKAEADAIAAGT